MPSARAGELLERLAARRDAELRQQALDVRAHRMLGDEETLRDLVRAEMAIEKQEHLELACGQRLGDRLRHDRPAAAFAHLVEQAPRDRSRKRGLALSDAAQEGDDPLRRLALQQVTGRT